MKTKNNAVFLDRDGTLIFDYGYLDNPDNVRLLPGCGKALRQLRDAGFKLVLITNQSGIGRGYFRQNAVIRQHERLASLLRNEGVALDAIEFCPHTPDEKCGCRKPNPGLLFKTARELDISLDDSYMVGDKPSDTEAGRKAGCRTVILGDAEDDKADYHAAGITAAAEWIINDASKSKG